MPVHNSDVAAVLHHIAELLAIEEANPYRVRAYRNAARTVQDLPRRLEEMLKEGENLSQLPGIGKDLAGKIEEIVKTGESPLLQELQKETPPQLAEVMKLEGIGPKRAKVLHQKLGVETLQGLEKVAQQGRIRNLSGFGEKTEENILDALERYQGREQRMKLAQAEAIAEPLVDYFQSVPGVKKVVIAGSYRRRKETVGDLDILVACKKGSQVMDRFVAYEDVKDVISKGSTRSTVRLRSDLQVDVRVVPEVCYGAALHYFTGNKAHNIAVRRMGQQKKLKINEYGVFKGDQRIAGRTEEEVYQQVDLPYVEPELRESRGEIEAAQKKQLPTLITLKDIRGDLHAHTKATDGRYSLQEMAETAKEQGYDYLAITDHTKHLSVAKGLDENRLARQIEEIDKLNAKLKGIRLLKGAEVDILEDGALDLDDGILKELDLTVCSIHYKFDLSRDKQTKRLLRAMDNPHCLILGHPTGRLINERVPYDVDLEKILQVAKERGCFVELNANPERLDLADVYCKMAKQRGVKVAISTDAHTRSALKHMRFGIDQARRGWLEADDVLNTRSWRDLKALLKRR